MATIVQFATTTVSLIWFCFLGVTGDVVGVVSYRDAIAFERAPDARVGMSIGGMILGPASTFEHEYGHVLQQRELGAAYLFVVGAPSFVEMIVGVLIGHSLDRWPETWADELGSQ